MRGIVAGSFDPITRGHVWLIEECRLMCDELVVLVSTNGNKHHTFDVGQRVKFAEMVCKPYENVRVSALPQTKLVSTYAKEISARFLFRGIRNATDYAYEHELQAINHELNPNLKTVFMCPPPELVSVSSSSLKSLGGKHWVHQTPRSFFIDRLPDVIHDEVMKMLGER